MAWVLVGIRTARAELERPWSGSGRRCAAAGALGGVVPPDGQLEEELGTATASWVRPRKLRQAPARPQGGEAGALLEHLSVPAPNPS